MSEDTPPSPATTATYQSDSWDDDGAHFSHTFSTYTELIGYSQARLYMSCPTADDMDVYVILRKLDASGTPLLQLSVPLTALPANTTTSDVPDLNIFKYVGPNGRLRASHRALATDPTLDLTQRATLAPATAWHAHDHEAKVPPDEVVALDVPLWPAGMIFDAGESIRLEVKGHEVTLPEFPALARAQTNLNRGRHFVHTGGDWRSELVLSLASGGVKSCM